MKYIKLFEARKIDDPFYHFALAINEYLILFIDPKYNPKVKWTSAIIDIRSQEESTIFIEIIKFLSWDAGVKEDKLMNFFDIVFWDITDIPTANNAIMEVLNKYPIKKLNTAGYNYRFPISILKNITDDFEILVAIKKYNV